MLLRRFMENIRDQNWLAVWLDFIIVVVGIFLALQATEWQQDRENRALEIKHLKRLEQSIEANIQTLEKAAGLQASLIENHSRVYQLLKTDDWSAEQELFVRTNIVNITYWRAIDLNLGAITSLSDSGELKLIRNNEIQEEIIRIVTVFQTLNSQLNYWRNWYIGMAPRFTSTIELDLHLDDLDYNNLDVRTLDGVNKLTNQLAITASNEDLRSKPVRDTFATSIPLRGNYLAHILLFIEQTRETRALVSGEISRLQ